MLFITLAVFTDAICASSIVVPIGSGGVLNHVRGFCESGFMRGKSFSTVNKNINEQEEKWYTEMYTDSAFANTASV